MGGRGASSGDVGKISQNLNAIRNAKRENLIIFDNNGNIIATETGNKQHVGYSEKDYKDRIVAHNHPSGVMPYPSEQDFKTAEKSGMKEMIVVSKDYTISYSIDKNYKGYGRQGIGYTIERNKNELRNIKESINNKTIRDYRNGKYKSVEDYRNDTIKKQTEAVLREYKKYAKNSGYKLKITKR